MIVIKKKVNLISRIEMHSYEKFKIYIYKIKLMLKIKLNQFSIQIKHIEFFNNKLF